MNNFLQERTEGTYRDVFGPSAGGGGSFLAVISVIAVPSCCNPDGSPTGFVVGCMLPCILRWLVTSPCYILSSPVVGYPYRVCQQIDISAELFIHFAGICYMFLTNSHGTSLLYNNNRDSVPIHFQYSVTSQSIVSRLEGSLPVWFAQLYYKSPSHYILLHYTV